MKVISYGDNVVDRYVNQNVMFPGGNCVNFAVYAKMAGFNVAYLGYFGEDYEADVIKDALTAFSVDISLCQVEQNTVTERCDVELIEGERIFKEEDNRNNLHGYLPLTEKELNYLADFDLIHSSCYAEVENEIPKLAKLNKLVTFDFSEEDEYRSEAYLLATCPYIDFALFSCEGRSETEIKALLEKVHKLGTQYVLATMGVNGQILYDGNRFYRGVVHRIHPVDTMGAGDSFFTSFVISMLKQGWKKGEYLSEEKIHTAFESAAKFSAEICLLKGAFGHGKIIR